jgi:hypothetical protein
MSNDQRNVVEFFQSEVEGDNWIYYMDQETGRRVGRQNVPRDVDYKCYMRFEDDGNYIEIVNDDGTTRRTLCEIYTEAGRWIEVLIKELAKAIVGAASGGRGIKVAAAKKASAVGQKKVSAGGSKKNAAVKKAAKRSQRKKVRRTKG